MRFIGDYTAKADSKGRVFLPSKLREVLEGAGESRCILRVDLFQPCLELYPESLWNEMLDMLRSRLNRWNGEHQHILRQFLADAEVVELDSNGRILINRHKMEYAGISTDVRFLSVDDHIEIWDKARCDQVLSQPTNLGQDLQDLMADLPAKIVNPA